MEHAFDSDVNVGLTHGQRSTTQTRALRPERTQCHSARAIGPVNPGLVVTS